VRWYQRVWDVVWKSRQRKIDAQILWPSIREQAPDIEVARHAFLKHAENDPAYSNMSMHELRNYVWSLPE
jgi:hypothetical protein